MHGFFLSLMLITVFLAGCSGSETPTKTNEVVIESKLPEEIESGNSSTYTPSPKAKGHLAGIVVDQAIRPLQGVSVRLPGLDLNQTTDRYGSFGFIDLYPGPYFLKVDIENYYGAESVVEVGAEKFTRVKVILEAIPPPTPRHSTQQFDGFAGITGTSIPLLYSAANSCTCTFNLFLEPVGLQAVVLEGTMGKNDGSAAASNNFYHYFRDSSSSKYHSSGDQSNPMRVEIRDNLGKPVDSRYTLRLEPESFPAPELNKKFQAFVTSFYYEVPPTGWSFVRGDP